MSYKRPLPAVPASVVEYALELYEKLHSGQQLSQREVEYLIYNAPLICADHLRISAELQQKKDVLQWGKCSTTHPAACALPARDGMGDRPTPQAATEG